jgi:preprotein translocase subunit SecG
LALGYFATQKADALSNAGLPDPALLQVPQEVPSSNDVPVPAASSGAAGEADIPQVEEQ